MECAVMSVYEIDFSADIVPGKSIAGFTISNQDCDDVRKALEKLDKNYYFEDNGDYIDVFSKDKQKYTNNDIVMSFFFNSDKKLNCINVFKTNNDNQYKGKILGKYGLGDKVIDLAEFGELERTSTGESFLLINSDNKYGLSVSNGLDVSLDEDPNQNIAVISVHCLYQLTIVSMLSYVYELVLQNVQFIKRLINSYLAYDMSVHIKFNLFKSYDFHIVVFFISLN